MTVSPHFGKVDDHDLYIRSGPLLNFERKVKISEKCNKFY